MQVHDELVLKVPEPELELVKEPSRADGRRGAELAVPLVVDVGVGRTGTRRTE